MEAGDCKKAEEAKEGEEWFMHGWDWVGDSSHAGLEVLGKGKESSCTSLSLRGAT